MWVSQRPGCLPHFFPGLSWNWTGGIRSIPEFYKLHPQVTHIGRLALAIGQQGGHSLPCRFLNDVSSPPAFTPLMRYQNPRNRAVRLARGCDFYQLWDVTEGLDLWIRPKSRAIWLHRCILRNTQRRMYTRSFSNSSKDWGGRTTPKDLLWSHHHPDTETRQRLIHTKQPPVESRHEGWGKGRIIHALPQKVPDKPSSIAINRTERYVALSSGLWQAFLPIYIRFRPINLNLLILTINLLILTIN